jgi:hypothetical protein
MITTQLNFIEPTLHGTPTTVNIANARHATKTLNLNGFELYAHETALTTDQFYNDDCVCSRYYEELTEALLVQLNGATQVIPIVHAIRNSSTTFAFDTPTSGGQKTTKRSAEYVPLVHCDNTRDQGHDMVKNVLAKCNIPMDDTSRYQVINVWRNIRTEPITIWNHPLAVLDVTTMKLPDDFIQTTTVLPKLDGHKSYHQWYYYDKMTKDEMLVFSRWDSRCMLDDPDNEGCKDVVNVNGTLKKCGLPTNARGVSTFHTAFNNPNPFTNYLDGYATPGRESIDTLCVVVYAEA